MIGVYGTSSEGVTCERLHEDGFWGRRETRLLGPESRPQTQRCETECRSLRYDNVWSVVRNAGKSFPLRGTLSRGCMPQCSGDDVVRQGIESDNVEGHSPVVASKRSSTSVRCVHPEYMCLLGWCEALEDIVSFQEVDALDPFSNLKCLCLLRGSPLAAPAECSCDEVRAAFLVFRNCYGESKI